MTTRKPAAKDANATPEKEGEKTMSRGDDVRDEVILIREIVLDIYRRAAGIADVEIPDVPSEEISTVDLLDEVRENLVKARELVDETLRSPFLKMVMKATRGGKATAGK